MVSRSLISEFQYDVLVSCMTFNHRNYIEDAMRGFCMQRTDFPYVAVVIDDASTDGEQEVIKRFLENEFDMVSAVQDETEDYVRVVAKHKTNVNCTFVVILLKYNHYKKKDKTPYFKEWRDNAKYIALCEGDDYWTDPLKLQRQVDFLEEHEEYSLCCTDAVIKSKDGEMDWSRYKGSCRVPVEDIIIGGGLWLQTVSFVYRNNREVLKNYPDCCKNCHVGDYPLAIWMALNGGVYYIAEKTAVYRYQCDGSWTNMQDCIPIEKQMPGWRSEVDMLMGLNNWSHEKYANVFSKRIIVYLYNYIILSHKSDAGTIMREFQDVKHLLSKNQRMHVFFLSIHQEKMFYRIMSVKKKIKNI